MELKEFDKIWEKFTEMEFMEQSDFLMGMWDGIWEAGIRALLYPLAAIAIYRLCKNAKIKTPILSIIPIFNMIYLVRIIKSVDVFGKKIGGVALTIILILCAIFRNPFFEMGLSIFTTFSEHALVGVFSIVGDVMSNCSIVFLFFYLLALHKLWEMYMPKSADCYLILATLFPWMVPILLFRIRNKQQVSSKLVIDYDSDGIIDEEVALHDAENIEVENENINEEKIKKKKLFNFRKNK